VLTIRAFRSGCMREPACEGGTVMVGAPVCEPACEVAIPQHWKRRFEQMAFSNSTGTRLSAGRRSRSARNFALAAPAWAPLRGTSRTFPRAACQLAARTSAAGGTSAHLVTPC